jgi:hypothetical protein
MQAVDGDSAARMQKGDPRILKDCPCDLLQKKYFTHRPSIVVFCLMLARRPAPRRSHQPWSSETLCSVPHHTTAFRSVAESLLWTGSVSWTGLKTARRSEPLPLVTCRCRSFDRAALWDFFHLLRKLGSAGPVSDRRLAVDQASDPAIDCVGRVDSGSSCCFLSWEHDSNGLESATFR